MAVLRIAAARHWLMAVAATDINFRGFFMNACPGARMGFETSRVIPKLNACDVAPTDDEHPFNPHGISIDEAHNLMVTSDYVCPVSTLHVSGGVPHKWEYPGLEPCEAFRNPYHRRRRPR
jgi:hypothetical protein